MIVKENKQYIKSNKKDIQLDSYDAFDRSFNNSLDQFKQLIIDTRVNNVPLKDVATFDDVKEGLNYDFQLLGNLRNRSSFKNDIPNLLRLDIEEKNTGSTTYLKFDVYSTDDYKLLEEFISTVINEIGYLNDNYESECKTIVVSDVHYKKFLFERRM